MGGNVLCMPYISAALNVNNIQRQLPPCFLLCLCVAIYHLPIKRGQLDPRLNATVPGDRRGETNTAPLVHFHRLPLQCALFPLKSASVWASPESVVASVHLANTEAFVQRPEPVITHLWSQTLFASRYTHSPDTAFLFQHRHPSVTNKGSPILAHKEPLLWSNQDPKPTFWQLKKMYIWQKCFANLWMHITCNAMLK